jgi:hypothetical protein
MIRLSLKVFALGYNAARAGSTGDGDAGPRNGNRQLATGTPQPAPVCRMKAAAYRIFVNSNAE